MTVSPPAAPDAPPAPRLTRQVAPGRSSTRQIGAGQAAAAAAAAALTHAAGSRRARAAASAAAQGRDDQHAGPVGRREVAAGGQAHGLGAGRAVGEPDAGVVAVDAQGLVPGGAVGADLEPQIVVADQAQFGPAAVAALEQQRQDVGGARPC